MKISLKDKLKNALTLFAIFFKIGLFSFGGGYAMFTMMEKEIVEKRGYLTHSELMDVFAIAESTPGAVSINIATFIGTRQAGVFGGFFTTLGVVLPSFLIIFALSFVIDIVKDNFWVACLFKGVRVGVLVLISKAVASFFRDMRKDWYDFVFLVGAFLIAFLTDISVVYIILGTMLILIIAVACKNLRKKKLGIIDNPDEYQRKLVEEYERKRAQENGFQVSNAENSDESGEEDKQ